MINIGHERLRTLYSILAGIPEERVDLVNWSGWSDGLGLKQPPNDLLTKNCGTVACAVGWACSYPGFKRMGLRWNNAGAWSPSQSGFPTYRNAESWDAVLMFFGVTYDQALNLFDYERLYNADFKDADMAESTYRKISDKRLALMRIRNYLHQNGVISAARCEELKRQERRGTFEFVSQG